MSRRRECVARESDAWVGESGMSIEANVDLRVFSHRADKSVEHVFRNGFVAIGADGLNGLPSVLELPVVLPEND